jgi:error-prone DNA polymerase
MTSPFTHLHVASGYSLRYGASTPARLVEVAVEHGMGSLALTDRDGLYGAVKFGLACAEAGIQPLLGVDLAVEPSGLTLGLPAWAEPSRPVAVAGRSASRPAAQRVPVRGGASVDPRYPRVTVLALAADPGAGLLPGQGWARLCRLVTATHLRGERGRPVSSIDVIVEHARVGGTAGGPTALMVLLGPGSEFGRAALAKRPDVARAVLERWRSLLPADGLAVEIVHHRSRDGDPASRGHAARMLAVAREAGIPAVLSNAVRHATRDGAVTVDVLDATRRLVPLDARHLDRTTAEGYLASPAEMLRRAIEVAEAAGDPHAARDLMVRTEEVAARCRLDPQQELGLWQSHLPEPYVIGLEPDQDANLELRTWCEGRIFTCYPDADATYEGEIRKRLDEELDLISSMDLPTYFLTVAEVCRLIRTMDVRVAARGSGAGSLVNHLLGISGVDPMRYGLLMERFVTPLRSQLPDIDLDVESDRRTAVYEKILDRFGSDRVTCVSMMDTYRVRHAIRDVAAALGLPPGETDAIAKSFPHIRARDVRHAIAELPELRASGLAEPRLDLLFDLVERLDGLPRHVALHPCGVVISDAGLLDRTPVEASWQGFPMSQFDKDDVEAMGLLKLDVLGIRMQSAMSYAIKEIARVDGPGAEQAGRHPESARYLDADGRIDLDAVPLDDEATYRLIRTTRTLGCFQIESPGQRELIGKFGPETFHDLIIDISLFRPGPVKSDMVNPFLRARKGWEEPDYLHSWLIPVLENTCGVVVFQEQVLQIVEATTGCTMAEADEVRRAMGSPAGQDKVKDWYRRRARYRGLDEASVTRIWEVLKAFASFGFCKAHAAAFALPTYQSAWLKTHHPAAFLAGVLTHDPGMYPKRLILDDARNLGISVLPLDVNHSDEVYRVERVDQVQALEGWAEPERSTDPDLPDGRPYGIRLSLAEVKGASGAEVARMVANRPYHSLADFWHRARVSRPVVERLVLAGGFDSIYGLSEALPVPARGRITRRDLLLQLGDLERWTRSTEGRGGSGRATKTPPVKSRAGGGRGITESGRGHGRGATEQEEARGVTAGPDDPVRRAAARQSQAARTIVPVLEQSVQMAFDLDDAPDQTILSGLPEMTSAERVRAELEILGLDASRHVLDFYAPLLEALAVTRARDVRDRRSRAEILVAGVKVATQTPPIRTGRRVVFLTLDDSTGPVDATFFEDAQGPYATTVFHSWLLVVRGVLRKTGARGISLRATGAWELPVLWDIWTESGLAGVQALLQAESDPRLLAGCSESTGTTGPCPAGKLRTGRWPPVCPAGTVRSDRLRQPGPAQGRRRPGPAQGRRRPGPARRRHGPARGRRLTAVHRTGGSGGSWSMPAATGSRRTPTSSPRATTPGRPGRCSPLRNRPAGKNADAGSLRASSGTPAREVPADEPSPARPCRCRCRRPRAGAVHRGRRLHDAAHRHGRVLRLGRTHRPSRAERAAGDRGRWRALRRPLGHLRGSSGRSALGDADGPGPPALSPGGGDRAGPPAVHRRLARRDGDLPVDHPAGGAAQPGRGLPRCLRRHPPDRLAHPDRRADPRPGGRRATDHRFGRDRDHQVRRQARLQPGQAGRPARGATRSDRDLPARARGRGALGGR